MTASGDIAGFEPANYRPLRDNILVQIDPWNEELDSGLVIVHTHERPKTLGATVLRVGPKAARDLKEGDRVLLPRHAARAEFRGPANEEWVIVGLDQVTAVTS